MKEYKYKLTLTVEDHGTRTFSGENESNCQGELAELLAYDISRSLAIMNYPPDADQMVVALLGASVVMDFLDVTAYVREKFWDCEHSFDSAVKATVDVGLLMGTKDDDEIACAVDLLRENGWTVTNVPELRKCDA